MATHHFKKKEPAEKREIRKVFRVTDDEDKQIRNSASVRQMDDSEFMRRACLGRKADVDYDTEIVLALSGITRALRAMHAGMMKQGIAPPESELLALILDARSAIKLISK